MQSVTLHWTEEQIKVLTKALSHLNSWRFLAAHEEFENLWRRAKPSERNWLHGLAQGAASLHQLTLGRGAAAVRTWNRARPKLEELELREYVRQVDAMHRALALREDGPRFFDASTLRTHSLPHVDLAALRPRAGKA